ncbi:MAG: glycosyltransferase, partial [Chitinivibrionales bacterium]|nr:glycosyltransferase [Chitinivibrionales bacterium]MBD3394299.1 glycosyltransferase [Chitinivibrionales bacterium]
MRFSRRGRFRKSWHRRFARRGSTSRPTHDFQGLGMKILMLNNEYPPLGGGASPFTRTLVEALTAIPGIRVDLVTAWFPGLKRTEIRGNLTIRRVTCVRLHKHVCTTFELFTYMIAAFFKGWRLGRTSHYDLIHAHFIVPAGIAARALSRLLSVPYIVSSHGTDVPGFNPDRFGLVHRVIAPWWRRAAADAAAIITPSRYLKELIQSKLDPADRVRVVPYGFDANRIAPSPEKTATILMVSRLLERKGIQFVLRALQRLETRFSARVVGDGPYRDALQTLARELGLAVTFTGWLEGDLLAREYADAAIFVFPSSSESFGMVLAEAMAGACAVVAARGTACEEVLGDCGLYVDPGSVDQLADAIAYLINNADAARTYGTRARERI